jgi:glutamine amidotransferase
MGNLRNVYMAFRRLGIEARVTDNIAEVRAADVLVLPGVGAFGDCIANVRIRDLERPIVEAIAAGVPFLGICVGMQLLFEVGEEMGEHRGLGVLPGRVRRFPPGLAVPHMGWNQIHQAMPGPMWRGVPDHAHVYFVHSYFADVGDPAIVAATTDYGIDYTSAVARDNLFAIQFHPEKSQDVGERILRNFAAMAGLVPADRPDPQEAP